MTGPAEVRAIVQRLGQEATPAEAARLMTPSHVLTGLRLKKRSGELTSWVREDSTRDALRCAA